MRVFWWQGGLHLEPQTDAECTALQRLQEALAGFGSVETSFQVLAGPAAAGRKGGLKGGKARAAKMTPEKRRESARKAAQARWGK